MTPRNFLILPPTMSPSTGDPISALRTINTLLSTTPDVSLPSQIPSIVTLLYSSPILQSLATISNASGSAQKQKSAEEASILLHKFKTRISSLLQSKSPQARWSGVALVKGCVESSFECLVSHGGVWVRSLVPLLGRPEPPSTHELALATLTRIFTALTLNKPTLIREIVAPNIPATITHILNLCSPSSSSAPDSEILPTLLIALKSLLEAHPVTFRPFAQKAHALALSILSAPEDETVERLVREIFVLLHLCASSSSKRISMLATVDNGASAGSGSGNKASAVSEEWASVLKAVIQETHSVLDHVFRSVLEDHYYGQNNGSNAASGKLVGASVLGFGEYAGILEAVERASVLLRMLQSFFALPTCTQISLPLGQLLGLMTRCFSITSTPGVMQANIAVETQEREILFSRLPGIHSLVLNLLETIVKRLGGLFMPFVASTIEQVTWVFGEMGWSNDVKVAVYTLLTSIFEMAGTGLAKGSVRAVHTALSAACEDLFPPAPAATQTNLQVGKGKKQNANASASNAHADSFLSSSNGSPTLPFTASLPGVVAAASKLLATSIHRLPTWYIRSELRTKMDRAAILSGNKKAMLGSVLFPAPPTKKGVKGGSILPHLVGGGVGLEVEGLVRPRLPIVWTGKGEIRMEEESDEEREEEGGREIGEVEAVNGNGKDEDIDLDRIDPTARKLFERYLKAHMKTGEIMQRSEETQIERSPKRQRLEYVTSITDIHPATVRSQPTTVNHPQISLETAAHVPVGQVEKPNPSSFAPQHISTPSSENINSVEPIISVKKPEGKKPANTGFRNGNVGNVDSDDEMEIPEIDLGEDSDSDDE
ncbi:hypothetical protein RUND412_006723 [Rhizina undulata]